MPHPVRRGMERLSENHPFLMLLDRHPLRLLGMTPTPLTDLRAYLAIFSLNSFPDLNPGMFAAEIVISTPVCG